MKLIEARVRMFRHILDSDPVPISLDVTCLVGKNESGKTAFLQALQRLKPERSAPEISAAKQYPAWLEKKHRRSANLDKHVFVEARFKVEDDDVAVLEAKFGAGILKSDVFTMKRAYDRTRTIDFRSDESKAIAKILSVASVKMAEHHDLPLDLEGLEALIATLTAEGGYEAAATDAKRLAETKLAMLADKPVKTAVLHALDKLTPTFFYFSDYSSLPGSVKIRELLEADRTKLSRSVSRSTLRRRTSRASRPFRTRSILSNRSWCQVRTPFWTS